MKKAMLLAILLLQVVTGFCKPDQADSLFSQKNMLRPSAMPTE
jgi:hypothetical protein